MDHLFGGFIALLMVCIFVWAYRDIRKRDKAEEEKRNKLLADRELQRKHESEHRAKAQIRAYSPPKTVVKRVKRPSPGNITTKTTVVKKTTVIDEPSYYNRDEDSNSDDALAGALLGAAVGAIIESALDDDRPTTPAFDSGGGGDFGGGGASSSWDD